MTTIEDYGVGTGSRNLFGGGMSKQELDKLLGLYPLSQANPMSAQDVPTAEALSTVNVPYREEVMPTVVTSPNLVPYESSPEFLAMMQANADQMAAGGTPQTQLQSLSGGMFTSEPQFTSGQQPAQSSIVQGMFPEVDAMQRALYQQKQNEAMQAQAMRYASLDPMQQAQYSLYLGGQQLGGAIGSALGGKDPQLQMISLQSRILSELDPSDPDQNIRIAKKYGQAAPELAMNIYQNSLSS